MRSPRIRTQVAFLLFILLPATAGIVAIHASATCERYVRTYITKPVRNRVSKQTAAAWAAWRVAHPNWKPNPNLHRPKYVMTREEALKKVNFACSVEPIPTDISEFFNLNDIEAPPPVAEFHPLDTTDVTLTDELQPTEVAELVPIAPFPPVQPHVPVVVGAVPEPSTLLLLLTGLAGIGVVVAFRGSKTRLQSAA